MSWDARASVAGALRETAIELAWTQWGALGGQVAGKVRAPRAVVDPEALVLFSCALRNVERRLWDLAAGLAATEASLLSVQRTRNLARAYPQWARDTLAEFASVAVRVGKDARWTPLAAKDDVRTYRLGKVNQPHESATERAALMLRLRLAFGVTARTDMLTYLIATSPEWASIADIARATCYGPVPVRRGVEAMAAARIIQASSTRPARYYAPLQDWGPLLGFSKRAPSWRFWHPLMVFLIETLELLATHKQTEPTDYMWSSDVRSVIEKHWPALELNRIQVPDPRDHLGTTYLKAFEQTTRLVADWVKSNV